jgi:hypothetical protein
MKLTGWMETTFAGVLSIGVLFSSAAAQDKPQEPTREVHLATASTPREQQPRYRVRPQFMFWGPKATRKFAKARTASVV